MILADRHDARPHERAVGRPSSPTEVRALRRGEAGGHARRRSGSRAPAGDASPREMVEALPDRSSEGRDGERIAFAWVHDEQHLDRATRELSDLLAFLNSRESTDGTTRLIGIWVSNQRGVPDPPVHRVFADGPVRIGDSAGLGGVWTLCWLRDEDVSAQDVVDALGEAYGSGPPSRFVPVVLDDGRRQRGVAPESVWGEPRADTVGSHPGAHPDPVRAMIQDHRTGRLKSTGA